jgi:hypothetical protein
MMGYLDRLKGMNSEKCLPSPLSKLPKAPYDSFGSTQGGRFQKITPPGQGATCPAWLATLDGELERRIRAMAERWGYSGDELAWALDAARQDPDGWRRVVDSDERGQ